MDQHVLHWLNSGGHLSRRPRPRPTATRAQALYKPSKREMIVTQLTAELISRTKMSSAVTSRSRANKKIRLVAKLTALCVGSRPMKPMTSNIKKLDKRYHSAERRNCLVDGTASGRSGKNWGTWLTSQGERTERERNASSHPHTSLEGALWACDPCFSSRDKALLFSERRMCFCPPRSDVGP